MAGTFLNYAVKVVLLIISTTVICFCNPKKRFHHVRITGRILHFYTKQPISTDIELRANYYTFGGSNDDTRITGGKSDENGYFSLTGNAARSGDYEINISGGTIVQSVNIKEDKTTDLGNFYIGTRTIYCKIKCIPD